jgi:hypothetical protein
MEDYWSFFSVFNMLRKANIGFTISLSPTGRPWGNNPALPGSIFFYVLFWGIRSIKFEEGNIICLKLNEKQQAL